MSNAESGRKADDAVEDDDEPDDWDKRIFSTGCAGTTPRPFGDDSRCGFGLIKTDENTKLNDCFFEKKDWRACKTEMEAFKQCWKRQGNDQRTDSKDA